MSAIVDWMCAAENTGYNAWQAMLFHFSVYGHTRRPPIIAVMAGSDEALLPEFGIIERMGGRVQRCVNYRSAGHTEHPGRNTAGAMINVESDADYVVVCDVDMLLTRQPRCPGIRRDEITVDNLPWYFLYPEHATSVDQFDRYLERAGLTREQVCKPRIWGGVPHVMHREVMADLGHEWLSCTETMMSQGDDPTTYFYECPMWGLMFACARLGLGKVRTSWCEHNNDGMREWDPWWAMIHYAWGEKKEFSKVGRDTFPTEELTATPGSINEQIVNQIREARKWYAPMTTEIGLAAA